MKDELGDRMKGNYEDRTRFSLPRRTYTIIRVDGKAFHTLTKGMPKPFSALFKDNVFNGFMDKAAKALCKHIQGAQFAYVQSDEISVLLIDFEKTTTDAWFDGNIQKMASVAASIATAAFNKARLIHLFERGFAMEFPEIKTLDGETIAKMIEIIKVGEFDARVFTIPDPIEVENYFIWRQKDATRNSVSMAAKSLYSTKELEGKSSSDKQDMIHAKGENWNDLPDGFKRGRLISYEYGFDLESSIEFQKCSPEGMTAEAANKLNEAASRGSWEINPAPDFLKERDEIRDRIPKILVN
jgi:tRNA(His) 5'-end guanylyltransferase